jgi:hypothetical protein
MEERELLHLIADYWGGKDCQRADHPSGVFAFRKDGFLYYVWRPGQVALLAEVDGRPFQHTVPQGRYLVRAINDAPDAWWYIEDDGAYTDFSGKTTYLQDMVKKP